MSNHVELLKYLGSDLETVLQICDDYGSWIAERALELVIEDFKYLLIAKFNQIQHQSNKDTFDEFPPKVRFNQNSFEFLPTTSSEDQLCSLGFEELQILLTSCSKAASLCIKPDLLLPPNDNDIGPKVLKLIEILYVSLLNL